MKRHRTLAFFVPNEGCPHRCSFCDQCEISGTQHPPTPQQVAQQCDALLPPPGASEMEIAFFGGSFTALAPAYRAALLAAAAPFVRAQRAAGIRVSTRPDAITPAILQELKAAGVCAVELGAQSMQDDVLKLNLRGHTAAAVRTAATAVQKAGFSLGLQMMVGLPGEQDAAAAALANAEQLCALGPDTLRIYPVLVLRDTLLARWAAQGQYTPLTLEQAVEATAPVIELAERQGIRVIRVGLQDDASLRAALVAGPYHPAFRQLCEARLYRQAIAAALQGSAPGPVTVAVAPGQRSTAAGQKNTNLAWFAAKGYSLAVCEMPGLTGRQAVLQAGM